MTTGPHDPAATGHDRLRAGQADREQVIETLKDAFAHGRLTTDELDTRAGRALSARTYADLAALTADLPPAPAPAAEACPPAWPAALTADLPPAPAPLATRPPRLPAPARRRRPLVRPTAASGTCLLVAAAGVWAHGIVDPGATPTPYGAWGTPFFLLACLAVLAALGIFAYGVITWAEQRDSRRQLPPPPGPGGRAARTGNWPGGTGAEPASPGRRDDQARADLRAHQPRRHRHIPARAGQLRAVRPTPGPA